ncbi:MAG: cation:proton antiporter [Gemmatimonadaceae bacterium]
MRQMIILVLLFGGTRLILPLGESGHGSEWLLTFGFLILAADTVGRLAHAVRLPRIVGYLAAGLAFGPALFGVVTADATEKLAPVSSLAIALIAFLAGAELRWSELREHGTKILKILGTEMLLTLVVLTGLLVTLARFVPFLRGADPVTVVVLSLMFSSVAIVHSPAVTMALLSETGARGPVARTTLGVVLVSDVFVILLFSAVLALARAVVPSSSGAGGTSFEAVAWEIGGAMLVGAALGGAIAMYLRFVGRELFLFAMLVAFFGAEIARLAHVETLLTLLSAGFVAENVSARELGEALRNAMERSAAPVFVVFFALAGASLHIHELPVLWPLVIPIVVCRLGAIWLGTRLGGRWGGASREERRYVWMGLVSQAGVAIGLATVLAEVFPERGVEIRTLFLTVIAVNETIGPIFFRHALASSGEIVDEEAQFVEERGEDGLTV